MHPACGALATNTALHLLKQAALLSWRVPTCKLHAGRATPNHHKVQQPLAVLRARACAVKGGG